MQLVYDKEAVEVARWLNQLGLDAWVLLHRLPGQSDGYGGVWPQDIALTNGLRALDHLDRTTGLDGAATPPPLLAGLSSRGRLVGTLACQPGGVNQTCKALSECGALYGTRSLWTPLVVNVDTAPGMQFNELETRTVDSRANFVPAEFKLNSRMASSI